MSPSFARHAGLWSVLAAVSCFTTGCDHPLPPPTPKPVSPPAATSPAPREEAVREDASRVRPLADSGNEKTGAKKVGEETELNLPDGVPAKVGTVLKYVDEHDKAPPGYEGGRTFENRERRLRSQDGMGRAVRYREWDVNPHKPGVNRGAERMITGSDGSAWYTDDHYRTFKKIR